MIQVADLKFGYGEVPLYEKVNFIVSKGQKVGLVGPNGSGKSTLLSIIMGKEDGYTGKVKVLGKIALVPQEVSDDEVMQSCKSAREYVDPQNLYEDFEILKLFSNLELNINLDSDPKFFSGGQKTKLALTRALLEKPDILLLDEPTNFMDTAGKAWVMNFLGSYDGTVIVISHDLDLMNKSIDKILDVNTGSLTIDEYKGNYTDYKKLKAEKEKILKKQVEIKTRHVKALEKAYQRIYTFSEKRTIMRRRIEREKANLPELPQEIRKVKIKLPEPKKVGEIPIKVTGIKKSFADKEVLKDVNFTLIRNEKIALVGPNGAGKSTLIKILMGMITDFEGRVERDEHLSIGYYSQEFETFDFTKTVIKIFCDETKKDEGFARAFLGRFGLSGPKIFQRVESLSGGEKTRLSIAILTGTDNNLLILDEPTTYLDVMSQRIILESLKEYKGTMLIVSHTPEFLKELNLDKAYLFPEEKMVYWDDSLLDKVVEV